MGPFVTALLNMMRYYNERSIDPFKDSISVPGIAERIAFKTLRTDEFFFLFPKRHKDVIQLLTENLVGGPSLVFCRYHEAGNRLFNKNNETFVKTYISIF